ncbi:MAG: histidine triad nucleotide-binding protein [Anaerolineae bacterium]
MGGQSCVFCQIVAGELPAKVEFETERVLAFRDINPTAPVHVLVIPKLHITDPSELDDATAPVVGEMFRVAHAVAEQLGVAGPGYRLVMNKGRQGGQSVFHMHLHLLGGRQMRWPPG